jgi:hypothetical protein
MHLRILNTSRLPAAMAVTAIILLVAGVRAGTIQGIVTDAATGDVLEGVHVTLIMHGDSHSLQLRDTVHEVLSDANGRYAFDDIAQGVYAVYFTCEGFAPGDTMAMLWQRTQQNVSIHMAMRAYTPDNMGVVEGVVVNARNDVAIQGAHVVLRQYTLEMGSRTIYSTQTGHDGGYAFDSVMAGGRYYVVVRDCTFIEEHSNQIRVSPCETTTVSFSLEPVSSALHTASAVAGMPGAGAIMAYRGPDGAIILNVDAAAELQLYTVQGRMVYRGQPAGTHGRLVIDAAHVPDTGILFAVVYTTGGRRAVHKIMEMP